jgi:hypothetical protein
MKIFQFFIPPVVLKVYQVWIKSESVGFCHWFNWHGMTHIHTVCDTPALLHHYKNLTIQAVYVWTDISARSCKVCLGGKAFHISYSECVFVCCHRYPACSVHAPYFHLWPGWICKMFRHCLINGTILDSFRT